MWFSYKIILFPNIMQNCKTANRKNDEWDNMFDLIATLIEHFSHKLISVLKSKYLNWYNRKLSLQLNFKGVYRGEGANLKLRSEEHNKNSLQCCNLNVLNLQFKPCPLPLGAPKTKMQIKQAQERNCAIKVGGEG